MTDIARKRTYPEVSKAQPQVKRDKAPAQPAKKQKKEKVSTEESKSEQKVEPATAEKALENVQADIEGGENEEQQYASDGTSSLFYLVSTRPASLKKKIEEIC